MAFQDSEGNAVSPHFYWLIHDRIWIIFGKNKAISPRSHEAHEDKNSNMQLQLFFVCFVTSL
jgi:hypothetical protein